jgi:hypothetical protein
MRVSSATSLVGTKVVHTRRPAATAVIALTMLVGAAYVMSPGTAPESPSSAKAFRKGDTGEKGDKGETGEKGDKGDKGATFDSSTIDELLALLTDKVEKVHTEV